jgi:hypothetical protein
LTLLKFDRKIIVQPVYVDSFMADLISVYVNRIIHIKSMQVYPDTPLDSPVSFTFNN